MESAKSPKIFILQANRKTYRLMDFLPGPAKYRVFLEGYKKIQVEKFIRGAIDILIKIFAFYFSSSSKPPEASVPFDQRNFFKSQS